VPLLPSVAAIISENKSHARLFHPRCPDNPPPDMISLKHTLFPLHPSLHTKLSTSCFAFSPALITHKTNIVSSRTHTCCPSFPNPESLATQGFSHEAGASLLLLHSKHTVPRISRRGEGGNVSKLHIHAGGGHLRQSMNIGRLRSRAVFFALLHIFGWS